MTTRAYMQKGKHLEDSRTDTTLWRPGTGPGWAQAGRPRPVQVPIPPSFDLDAIRLFVAPGSRATQDPIRHRPLRSRGERDTILERVELVD
jgi:hypothetical protein